MACIKLKGPGRQHGFICTDDEPLTNPNPDCPNADLHTPQPKGYVALSNWADEMLGTHDQQECPGCGILLIWVPKEAQDADA